MNAIWRIELLGRLCIRQEEHEIVRFRTRKTGALLAYLAYFAAQAHPREELIERFWPEDDAEAGRNSLRVALNALRRQLEPEGVAPGSALRADRASVQISSCLYTTDVAAFEAAFKVAGQAPGETEQTQLLLQAVERYRGDLLPGHDAWWVLAERRRLTDLYLGALRRLARNLYHVCDFDRALDYARRAVIVDPLREASHRTLIRLYTEMGRPAAALTQYRELERILQAEFAAAPAAETRELVEPLVRELASALPASWPALPMTSPDSTTEVVGTNALASSSEAGTPSETEMPSEAVTSVSIRLTGRVPAVLTRFFGREEERTQLQKMLAPGGAERTPLPFTQTSARQESERRYRLVTLTGAGGSGKTRLAIEVASQLQAAYVGAIWFAPLADLENGRRLPEALCEALGLPRTPQTEPLERLAIALAERPALLVLDNFEHLLSTPGPGALEEGEAGNREEDGRAFVRMLLACLPHLTCLVTSRQRLNLEGEQEFLVMPLPTPLRPGTPERLMEFPGLQLFVDRARATRRSFQVTERNAGAIVELCRRLEGVPLAIELAAAWAQTLTPAQMLSRLSDRFDLLVSRQPDQAVRHRTLDAAIDWSFRLLSPTQQAFFLQLGVFRGGWTLEAAEAICIDREEAGAREEGRGKREEKRATESGEAVGRVRGREEEGAGSVMPTVMEMTAQLRDRSLILVEETEGDETETLRFRLLEMVRAYVRERWRLPLLERLSQRHADFFLEMAEHARAGLNGPEQAVWLERLEREHDNLRAAFAWFAQTGQTRSGLRLAGALSGFWIMHGHLREGRMWLEQALAPSEAAAFGPERAVALHGAASLMRIMGDHVGARERLEESLALFREHNDRRGLAHGLTTLASLHSGQGEPGAARDCFEEALAILEEIDDPAAIADTLTSLGLLEFEQGDLKAAAAHQEACLRIHRQRRNLRGAAIALAGLGMVAYDLSDFALAGARHEESLALFRKIGERRGIAYACLNLGMVRQVCGDLTAARTLIEESLLLRREVDDRHGIADALCGLGIVASREGDSETARRLYAESLEIYRALGYTSGIALASARLAECTV